MLPSGNIMPLISVNLLSESAFLILTFKHTTPFQLDTFITDLFQAPTLLKLINVCLLCVLDTLL